MNSVKIEMGAVLALKNVIQMNNFMKDYINDNDKEPSWDGHIYLYKSDDMKAENIKYRVPVQIKGKNDESLLERQRITFPVEYKHLRNYYQDGGIFYVVVIISNDRRRTTIFYNALTAVKLNTMLKKSEDKRPDQRKNIVLECLKECDDSLLLAALMQFGFDREQQGSGNGGIIEKAININTIDKVDSIRVTSYLARNETEALEKVSAGELCLYGHRADLDMWLPFDYEHQQNIEFTRELEMEETLGVDGTIYYDHYLIEGIDLEIPTMRVSENLTINLLDGKINLESRGNIESLKKDVDFLYAVVSGQALEVGGKQLIRYKDVNLNEGLQENMKRISDFYNALKEIEFTCHKRVEEFNDSDWNSVAALINLYHRNIKMKENQTNDWFMWWWDGKVIPLFIVQDEKGQIQVVNWMQKEGYIVFDEKEEKKKFRMPKGIFFKRDIWEKLYDVEEEILLRDIKQCDYSDSTTGALYSLFLEILSAYDATKNEKYFDMATVLITKLLEVNRDDEGGIINRLQLIKRKRGLSAEEIAELEIMEEQTENDMLKCAVNILLENKHRAKKMISQLSEEDQKAFRNYPIYKLL
ncbi:MAG: hypothetical protein ACLTBS_08450 [Eisenbergiella sp.]